MEIGRLAGTITDTRAVASGAGVRAAAHDHRAAAATSAPIRPLTATVAVRRARERAAGAGVADWVAAGSNAPSSARRASPISRRR